MKSIATKISAVLAAILLVLCGAACAWYATYRLHSTADEAVQTGELLADAFGVSLIPALQTMDTEAVSRLVAAAGTSELYDAVAVVGRSGRILAASPPLPDGVDPVAEPRCAGCHAGRPEQPQANLVGANDARTVQVFRPLGRPPACTGCHGSSGEPLGYVYLEVPMAAAFARLHGETLLVSGIGVLTILAILLASYRAVTILAVRPLRRLQTGAERVHRGESAVRFDVAGGDELGTLAASLEAASSRQGAIAGEISSLADHLRERGTQAETALGQLREGVTVERGVAESILQSVAAFDQAMEQTRSSLNAIASATSDNSTSLIQMSASVDAVAVNADQLAQQVAGAAEQVGRMARSVGDVAERADTLAGEVDGTASFMGQIDGSTRQIEQNAREAAGLSGRMADAAGEGSRAVEETIGGIHASYRVIQETARVMGELGDASRAIGGVVKIINEINDKTKLLSLNAAIIAAQAGEHGKSFGVVAHEIKSLSDRTASSTGQISRIVEGIQGRVETAAAAVRKGEGATARSLELAEGAGRSLERIRATVDRSHDMTREILRATEEQARGSAQVMASMAKVSELVAHLRQSVDEHRHSGTRAIEGAEVMRGLTEQVRHATAEQAQVSRYLSEAISSIDQNLRELLQTVERERRESENILSNMVRLKGKSDEQEQGVVEVESVFHELQAQIAGLEARAAELAGVDRSRH